MPEFDNDNDSLHSQHYPLIQTLLYNTPLLIAPDKAEVLHNVLQGYAMGQPPAVDAAAFQARDRSKSYSVTKSGIAVIPVYGTLVHRAGFLDAMSGLTSYRKMLTQLREAERDADVKAVLLDEDSGGGSVAGLFEFAEAVKRLNAVKPVWSISNESMFSAAYAIGAATSRVIAPRSAMVGSIGVIMMHMDQSKSDEKQGKKYTPIYAGHHKIDGSSHAPLSEQARSTYQHMVDDVYGLFVAHVSAGRPGMDAQAVIDTQANIFTAPDAQKLGLIDTVASYDETLDMLESELRTSVSSTLATASNNSESSMTTEKDTGTPVITQADLDAAVATARAEGHDAGLIAGREAEQARVSSILELESAQPRIDGTLRACIDNGLGAEAAEKFLAAAALPEKSNDFFAHMSAIENPRVASESGSETELTEDQLADRAVSLV